MGRSKKKKQSREGNPTPVQVVGTAFVEQYYHIQSLAPELIHRFYHDSSLLSRQDTNGDMTTVTTLQGIHEKILSQNYEDYKTEIQTADAQKSFMDGVTVLVTGCLTGKDNVRRKFLQTFFLAPQDNGYFVLNDVLRFFGGDDELQINSVRPTNDTNENTSASALSPKPEPTYKKEEEEVTEPQSIANVNESLGASMAQEDAPKKTDASTRKKTAMRSLPECTPLYTLTSTPRIPPSNQLLVDDSEENEEVESGSSGSYREGRNSSGNGGFYKKTSKNKWVPDSKQFNLTHART